MDLGAYMQIDLLSKIAEKNGIEIPRLRGYRLMIVEEPISQEEIGRIKKRAAIEAVMRLCEHDPYWCCPSPFRTWNERIRIKQDYYLTFESDEHGYRDYTGIRWDRIHGKKRRVLKFAIKQKERAIQRQYDLWNKYAGKANILYIHSRTGALSWYYCEEKDAILNAPWFLDRVDDWWDPTYCDFYAKIEITEAEYAEFLALLEKENDNDAGQNQ